MARKPKVDFLLRPSSDVSEGEVKQILRGADSLIASGGRTLLAKILKGSKEKKILELELDKNPSYGCFRNHSLDEVMAKIDWMITNGYLEIQYSGTLPMLVFTDMGWEIERLQYVEEILHEWDMWIQNGVEVASMEYLKDRNRGMILLLLSKVEESGDPKYIPLLREWEKGDYKKVREQIRRVISCLQSHV